MGETFEEPCYDDLDAGEVINECIREKCSNWDEFGSWEECPDGGSSYTHADRARIAALRVENETLKDLLRQVIALEFPVSDQAQCNLLFEIKAALEGNEGVDPTTSEHRRMGQ